MSYFVFWCGHSRDSYGYYYLLCNCLVGALSYSPYVMRSFLLCGVGLSTPHNIIDLDNHHSNRQKGKKRYPGCLARVVIGMFYSVVASQLQPIYKYNILQRRCQTRPTTIYILRGGIGGGGGGEGRSVLVCCLP